MKITDRKIKNLFSQAYIFGGSPCSGKSTIAERLSKDFKFQYYKVDDHEGDHSKRSDPNRHPVMHAYAKMRWNEIWLRSPSIQVHEIFDYYRERFEMMAQDLTKYDPKKPIILEGAAFLPEMLEKNNANQERVIYIIPSKEFQIHHYRQRSWIKHTLKECENPEQAFENWMMRDHLFGKEILQQARDKNFKTIVVDGKRTIDDQYAKVKKYFGFV